MQAKGTATFRSRGQQLLGHRLPNAATFVVEIKTAQAIRQCPNWLGMTTAKLSSPVVQTVAERWLTRALLGMFVLVWLGALASRSLISPDEGRYASLSLDMLQSGDWITPRLNGLLYFEKPPLQCWVGAASMWLLGVNEFSARLWPGLSGLAAVFLLGLTARRLWGPAAGMHALLIAGATTWIVANGHFLTLDSGLNAALTLVLCALLLAHHAGNSLVGRRWMLTAWAGVGLAVLSKGLVGILIPGAVFALHSVWRRDFSMWRRLQWVPGLAILLVIAAPWFILVSARNPDFASFFFVHEHLQRYLTPVHRREGAWWYFLPFVAVGFLPWTSSLPWVARASRADFAQSFLLVWAAFVLVFFSLSSSKLPSYILPMFPALALLLAKRLDGVDAAVIQRHLWLPVIFWAAALLSLPVIAGSLGRDTPRSAVDSLLHGIAFGAILFLAAAAAGWVLLRNGRVTAAIAVVACGHFGATLTLLGSHDAYGQLKSSDAMVRLLAPQIDGATPVFSVRTYDQTFPF